jgi:hypothetical protein
MPPKPPDWLIRRDILKAAQGAPFAAHTTVYAPPLEWSSERDTIHGAAIRPVLLTGSRGANDPVGWLMRLDYVDAPIRLYVHWLWRLGCDPSWLLWSPNGAWGDMSTPHSSIEVGAWESMAAMEDTARIRFVPLPDHGLTHSVYEFDRFAAAIAAVIEDGYDYAGLCEALARIA